MQSVMESISVVKQQNSQIIVISLKCVYDVLLSARKATEGKLEQIKQMVIT